MTRRDCLIGGGLLLAMQPASAAAGWSSVKQKLDARIADPRFNTELVGRLQGDLSGRSLLPMLRDPTRRHRDADEAIGYELAGHGALFRGDLKLLRIPPPAGDGRWRLYDITNDPGETRDLSLARPTDYADMIAAYTRYEQ